MKSSPFDNFADFSAATGPVHTFANNPMMINIAIGLTALIGILLIVKSYSTKH
jgi:hypothetical protein